MEINKSHTGPSAAEQKPAAEPQSVYPNSRGVKPEQQGGSESTWRAGLNKALVCAALLCKAEPAPFLFQRDFSLLLWNRVRPKHLHALGQTFPYRFPHPAALGDVQLFWNPGQIKVRSGLSLARFCQQGKQSGSLETGPSCFTAAFQAVCHTLMGCWRCCGVPWTGPQ